MQLAIEEVKIRAKKLLKQLRSGQSLGWITVQRASEDWQLKHIQLLLARQLGFGDWQHAHQILSGAVHGDAKVDFGQLWYERACGTLVNHWFADYQEARQTLHTLEDHCLYPFRHQFVVAAPLYAELLGLPALTSPEWQQTNRDLVKGYGGSGWQQLTLRRICHKLDSLG